MSNQSYVNEHIIVQKKNFFVFFFPFFFLIFVLDFCAWTDMKASS